jgi:hypothetical protein
MAPQQSETVAVLEVAKADRYATRMECCGHGHRAIPVNPRSARFGQTCYASSPSAGAYRNGHDVSRQAALDPLIDEIIAPSRSASS